MKNFIVLVLLFHNSIISAQLTEQNIPFANIRLSFLVFPPITPLLTLEFRTLNKLTIQLETNFVNTHGVNLKYFTKERMNKDFVFIGTAFVKSDYLRKDLKSTILPYIGYGYAYRFGKSNDWIFDSRIGIGRTINADKNTILPVIKTGIGKTF
jgi:hypothetical protein